MQVNILEAKAKLSELVQRSVAGEEVIITKAGEPLVRLIKYEVEPNPRRLGLYKEAGISMGEGIHDGDVELAVMFGMEI
ncbi:type II toxin-antitoxin system Phd/YefM family antitoxin [Cohaesibacter haloalkalitolerans]|uniref:type II toxin-antitoxin system Phd/YefM family antitoxin n=1 Tax=Cohaesibacter haloalkalitolerans TaxID=1162980 RepID=UPI000E65E4B7|nr:type II toxin-antitoxin system prevent-host-death family antitoxin [Cohaesibacter haloalkalitolerans]